MARQKSKGKPDAPKSGIKSKSTPTPTPPAIAAATASGPPRSTPPVLARLGMKAIGYCGPGGDSHGEEGVIVGMTADRCSIQRDKDGGVERVKWDEVSLLNVRPDPAVRAERQGQSLDRHGVPVAAGCVIRTELDDVGVVTSVQGNGVIFRVLSYGHDQTDRDSGPDLDGDHFDSNLCDHCVVTARSIVDFMRRRAISRRVRRDHGRPACPDAAQCPLRCC